MPLEKALKEAVKISYKVLIVDNNNASLSVAKDILQRENHKVTSVSNAAECLTILEGNCNSPQFCEKNTCESLCFDIILIDFDLSDVTGGTLGSFIRSRFPNIGIVFFSAYGKLPAIARAAESIHAQIITQPFSSNELFRVIHHSLEKQRVINPPPVSSQTVKHILQIATISRNINIKPI